MPIRLLASDVIDQIAAGEVIERPSSVLKELLENALDAGAKHLHVTLEGGGLVRLMVEDNGSGMALDDLRLCVVRHATSKLWHAEDLFNISTLGFRGEALSSIASVSRLTITSRRMEDKVGHRLAMEAGRVILEEQVGCPVGTVIDVRDLFFNVPARRKFLRSPATEQAHAVEAALRVMLGHADAGIVVQAGGRRVLDIPHAAEPIQRVRAALGRRVDQIVSFSDEVAPLESAHRDARMAAEKHDGAPSCIRVSGFITPPGLDRADAKGIWVFVNGRFVRDRMLQRAVIESYSGLLADGRYPTVIVSITVDPTTLDVNVHPQKTEVRFSHSGAVFHAVSYALARALLQAPWANLLRGPRMHAASSTSLAIHNNLHQAGRQGPMFAYSYDSSPVQITQSSQETGRELQALREQHGLQTLPSASDHEMLGDAHPHPHLSHGFFASLRVLGMHPPHYGLYHAPDGSLICVDHHTARVIMVLAQSLQEWRSGCLQQHVLLFPAIVVLDAAQHAVLTAQEQQLPCYGLEIDAVGPQRFAVRSVPLLFAHVPGELIAQTVLESMALADPADLVLTRLGKLSVSHQSAWEQPTNFLDHLDQAIAVVDTSAYKGLVWPLLGGLWARWSHEALARAMVQSSPT